MGINKFLDSNCNIMKLDYYKAANKDFKFISSLFKPENTVYYWTKRLTREDIKRLKRRDNYILTVNKTKIGWFILKKQNDTCEFGIIIDKPFQNKGYGQQTMEIAQKEAKKMRVKRIKILVFEKNIIARRIYTKAGFKETNYLVEMEKKI